MPQLKNNSENNLAFFNFWLFIALQLGDNRLAINAKAKNIHQIIQPNSDTKPYLVKAIQRSYKYSHCHSLKSAICINSVLDILGEIAYQLKTNQQDDLLDIELLEEIAWHINQHYRQHIKGLKKREHKKNRQKAVVVSLPNYKTLIRNRQG